MEMGKDGNRTGNRSGNVEIIWKCGNACREKMFAQDSQKKRWNTWNGENMETGNRWKFTCVPPRYHSCTTVSVSVREKI